MDEQELLSISADLNKEACIPDCLRRSTCDHRGDQPELRTAERRDRRNLVLDGTDQRLPLVSKGSPFHGFSLRRDNTFSYSLGQSELVLLKGIQV